MTEEQGGGVEDFVAVPAKFLLKLIAECEKSGVCRVGPCEFKDVCTCARVIGDLAGVDWALR